MNWTKLTVGALIAGVIYFFLGWAVYGFALQDAMTMPDGMKEVISIPETEMSMGLMILSCLAWGALLAFVIYKSGVSTWQSGAITAAIVAALISLSVGAGQSCMFKFTNMTNTMIDILGNAFCSAVAGAAAGWYFGRDNK